VKNCGKSKCQYCNLEMDTNQLPTHNLICEESKVNCPICSNLTQRKFFFNHNNGSCLESLLNNYINGSSKTRPPNKSSMKIEEIEKENENLKIDLRKGNDNMANVMREKLDSMAKYDKIYKEKLTMQEDKNNSIKIIKEENEKLNKDYKILIEENKNLKNKMISLDNSSNSNRSSNQDCSHKKFLWYRKSMNEFCSFCNKPGNCRYKCEDCLRFYCHKCKICPKANTCPIGHAIKLVRKINNYKCDVCFKPYNMNTYCWNDAECDLDICGGCWEIPKQYLTTNTNTGSSSQSDLINSLNKLLNNMK